MSSFFHSRLPVVVVAGVLISAAVSSAFSSELEAPLSLADVLRRASQKNPALLAQSYEGRAAAARIDQAGVRLNPTLDVTVENFAGTGALRGFDGAEATVQASQTLERAGKREKRVAVAQRDRDTADREFAVHERDLHAAAAAAYVGLLTAQARLALAAEPLTLARETVEAAGARVQAGAGSAAEPARARATQAAAQAEYARAEVAVANARAALAAVWGGVASEVSGVQGGLPVLTELPAEEVFLARLAAHPRLELQQALISSRRASLRLEQAQATEDVRIGGGVRFLRDGSDAALVAGISIPLRFRNQNQGNIRAARETLAGAEQSVRSVEHELRTSFAAAWRELQAARVNARTLRAGALPATEEASAIVRRAYQQGELPLIDVLDAQRALSDVRREILAADAAAAAALVQVEALTDPTFPLTSAFLSSR